MVKDRVERQIELKLWGDKCDTINVEVGDRVKAIAVETNLWKNKIQLTSTHYTKVEVSILNHFFVLHTCN